MMLCIQPERRRRRPSWICMDLKQSQLLFRILSNSQVFISFSEGRESLPIFAPLAAHEWCWRSLQDRFQAFGENKKDLTFTWQPCAICFTAISRNLWSDMRCFGNTPFIASDLSSYCCNRKIVLYEINNTLVIEVCVAVCKSTSLFC